jgi:hypothetical protein
MALWRRRRQDTEQRRVFAHRSFVDDDHVAVGQREHVVVESPGERGQGAGGLDAGLALQGSRRLARRRGADHLEAFGLEGLPHRRQGCGLAGAGHAHDKLGATSRRGDAQHRGSLAQREMGAQLPLPGGNGAAGVDLVHRRGVGARHLDVHGGGDGLLGGDDRRRGIGPLPGHGRGHEGDGLGVGQHLLDHGLQLGRILPEQLRRHRHHDVSAGEHLAGGQGTVEIEHLGHDSPALVLSQSTGTPALGTRSDDGALHRPPASPPRPALSASGT